MADDPPPGIEFDPRVRWAEPLVMAALGHGLVEEGAVTAVRILDPPEQAGTWDAPYGSCLPVCGSRVDFKGGARYEVGIALFAPLTTLLGRVELRPIQRAELIDTLAHELAHARYRDHGEEHERLTQAILDLWNGRDGDRMGERTMLEHDTIVVLIEESLGIMAELLPHLRGGSDAPPPAEPIERYERFLVQLGGERGSDLRFVDDAWNWIWEEHDQSSYSSLQLYGRVAFISYELFHFL